MWQLNRVQNYIIVTSVGPMNLNRILVISKMTENVKSGIIYVSAFKKL